MASKVKKEDKKLEGVVIAPTYTEEQIRAALMYMFKKQGIKVKKG
jgi:DNA polymerase III delta subunit